MNLQPMFTTDKDGYRVRGFSVVAREAGAPLKRRVQYPAKNEPWLTLDQAAKLAASLAARGCWVRAYTSASIGSGIEQEELTPEDLEALTAELPIEREERQQAADLEKAERTRKLKELQARRLFAPDIDTQADMIDPLKAENPLLAFRY